MAVRTLSINLVTLLNDAVEAATVTLSLMANDQTGSSTVVISSSTALTDSSGNCAFTSVIPNVDGSQDRRYHCTGHDGVSELFNVEFQMPDADSDLNDLIGAVASDSVRLAYLDADQTFTGTNIFGTSAAPKTTVFNGAIDLDGNVITDFLDQDDMSSNSATAVASQQSVKSYVDSQVATVDTLAEVLALGNTTGGTNVVVTAGDAITTNTISETTAASGVTIDSVLLKDNSVTATTFVGALTGNASTVTTNANLTGDITSTGNATSIAAGVIINADVKSDAAIAYSKLGTIPTWNQNTTGTASTVTTANQPAITGLGTIASLVATTADINAGTVDAIVGGTTPAAGTFTTLTANTSLALATGATVTGVDNGALGTSATLLATQGAIKTYVDAQVGTVDTLAEILANGNTTGGTDLAVSAGDDITFADNSKAIFGAGSDLEIYHNATDSFIDEKGAGWLYIRGNNTVIGKYTGEIYIKGIADGAVELYYDNAVKLATTSTGIDVTGAVTADGLTVQGSTDSTVIVEGTGGNDASLFLTEAGTGTVGAQLLYDGGDNTLYLKVGNNDNKNRLSVSRDTGDISFYEDTGTTAKFFWDASAESLGIGTTSPSTKLEVSGEALVGSGTDGVKLSYSSGNSTGIIDTGYTSTGLEFRTGNAERMRIDSSGNVGIGTTSPQSTIDLGNASGGTGISWGGATGANHYNTIWSEYSSGSLILGSGLKGSTSAALFLAPYTGTLGYAAIELDSWGDDGIKFYAGADAARTEDDVITPTEHMRITPAGNVTIGSTTSSGTKFRVQQDAAQTGLFIDQNGNSVALDIDTEATSAGEAINISLPQQTAADVLRVYGADSLTTGSAASFHSNSASTSTRNVVEIINDNTAATGATALSIQQDSTEDAIRIENTTTGGLARLAFKAVADNGGAGNAGGIYFDAGADGSAADNYLLFNADHQTHEVPDMTISGAGDVSIGSTTSSGTRFKVFQDAAATAIYVDQNGQGAAIEIDSESTGTSFHIVNPLSTTTSGVIFLNGANSLTTGSALAVTSNSASTSTRNLLYVVNDNPLATGTRAAYFQQDAAEPAVVILQTASDTGLFLDQNGNGPALTIDSESTSTSVIDVAAATTTGEVVNLIANSLTTGRVLDVLASGSAFSTGELARFFSDSSNTSTRNLVEMTNDNTAATGATVLKIQQDAAQHALAIDQNGNAAGLYIDTEATTAAGINIVSPAQTTGRVIDLSSADSLTSGYMIVADSNSASTSSRTLVRFAGENALAVNTTVLEVESAAGMGLLVDQNGNAKAISIQSESTTSDVLEVNANALTTGRALDVVVSPGTGFTTGSIARFYSGSSDSGTKNLVEITNDNAGASGSTVLNIQQDASTTALKIAHSANGHSLDINTPSASAAYVSRVINANSLTTGRVFYAHSNSASTSTRNLVEIVNDNSLATGTHGLHIKQDSTSRALSIDHNANGRSIDVDSTATTNEGMYIDMGALTTGKAAHFRSTGSDTSTRTVVQVENNDSLATGAKVLTVTQASAAHALFIDQNGNGNGIYVDSEATTANVITAANTVTSGSVFVATSSDSLTTGSIINVASNSASTSTRDLVRVVNDNTAATGTTVLSVTQDAAAQAMVINQNAASSFIDFRGTEGANTTDPISTHGTAGSIAKWVKVELNGTSYWLAAYNPPSS